MPIFQRGRQMFEAAHPRRGAADCSEHRQAAGALAEAVISSVELIVQPGAKDAVGVVALGPAKRIIIKNSLPRPTSSGRTERPIRCNRESSWDPAPRKPPVHDF
jgi:hypothetical protein